MLLISLPIHFLPCIRNFLLWFYSSAYKQIISDNKEKGDCVIKQEFLDSSIDLRDSAITFYSSRLQNRRAGVRKGQLSGARSQFPIQVDLRGYRVYSRDLGDLPIA